MQAIDIYEKLKKEYADAILEIKDESPSDPYITVDKSKLFDICQSLRDDDIFSFNYLMCLSGMDLGDNLGVVYNLYSYKHSHKITIKVEAPKETPHIASVERLWRTADWHEREAYDLYGVIFDGHHNLIRILNPYDWEGYPLRKDYETPEYYHGMKVPY